MTCCLIEPDSAIAEWDMYSEAPSAETPPPGWLYAWRLWPEWVTDPVNDGVEVFSLPKQLTQGFAKASYAELEELAGGWTTRLRYENGDDMTDDDLLTALLGAARRPASAVSTGGGLYSRSL